MRKLNNKNKLFILLFSLVIIVITVLLVYSISLSGKYDNLTDVYDISTNSVVYDQEDYLLNTKNGGNLKKSWDAQYYYVDFENNSHVLGDRVVVYDKVLEEVFIFGDNHFISANGNVTKNTDETKVSNTNNASFYKLDDRSYLIIAKEIYNDDKTIYTSKYLIVNIDKQGNASLLNDVINIKTINPMKLTFNDYVFDIANEKLTVNSKVIDLKLINGSTNEYIPREKIKVEDPDMNEFIDSYNKLVNDFTDYVNNSNMVIGNTNQIINNTIINSSGNNGANSNSGNRTGINKRVSLRGVVSYPTYLDVSYVVTDPEEKYQAVYLVVSGVKDGELFNNKILLDKYDTSYRIVGLTPKNEYKLTFGYIEVQDDGSKTLLDVTADEITVRTTPADMTLKIDKIASGYVHCTFKMTDRYAISSGRLVLLANGHEVDGVNIKYLEAKSDNGFKAKLKLEEGTLYEVIVDDAIYNGNPVTLDVREKFTFQSLKVE